MTVLDDRRPGSLYRKFTLLMTTTKNWWIPNKTFKIRNDTRSPMAGGISCSRMKQITLHEMLGSDSYLCAFNQPTIYRIVVRSKASVELSVMSQCLVYTGSAIDAQKSANFCSKHFQSDFVESWNDYGDRIRLFHDNLGKFV